jgi:peptide deformylase
MAQKLKILQINNKKELEILRKKSREVTKDEIKSSEFQSFLDDLIYTAQNTETEEGYRVAGLASIQVGKDLRAFCILREENKFEVMINPKIDILKPTQQLAAEACLSIPGTEGEVLRFNNIRVTYLDREGKKKRLKFTDWEAREIQHENDHLDGTLFIDKIAH